MDSLRYAVRRLIKSPMFALVSILTLAIGIGANTAIFSVVRGVLLKPLPYPESDRLVGLWLTAPGINLPELNSSPATYFTYREEGRTFEDVGLWRRSSVAVTGLAEPEQVRTLGVTDGLLPILRIQPLLGRTFSQRDDSPGAPLTAILSHGFWQRRFGGDRNVLGRTIQIDGRSREIIGVMPEDFRFLDVRPELILPMQLNRAETFIGQFSYMGIARMKHGVTVEQANADVARMLPLMITKFPPPPGMKIDLIKEAKIGANVRPFTRDVVGDVGTVLWVLMGTVGIVLLIACANVANLLLVRADGRQQEFAIRAALGAGWGRIARDMVAESVALGVLGVALSYGALRLLVKIGPRTLPRLDEIGIDGVVLAFTAAVSLACGLLFGLAPVLKYAGPRIANALRAGGRNISEGRERHRTRGALVVMQVALALVLLISSGLMIRTVMALQKVDPGFTRPAEVLTMRVSIPTAQVPQAERVARMYHDIVNRIAEVPGVRSAALSNSVTMDGSHKNDPIFAQDRTYSDSTLPPIRRYKHVSPGAIHTLGNRLLAGRDFTWTDVHEAREVVIVSGNFAREFWGSPERALGKRVRERPQGTWREIVGVVGDERDDGADKPAPTVVYWPMTVKNVWGFPLETRRSLAIVVRSERTGSTGFLQDVQRAVWAINPNLPVANVRTLKEIQDASMARTSFTLVMLSIAAATALLLGIVGIYGVISYSVSQRTREIGIRMALGATQGNVRRLFVGHGVLLTGIGVVCGFAAAVPLTKLMQSLLYATSPMDPLTYAAVAALLVSAAALAAYLPARRATVVEPVQALRFE